MHVPVRLCRRLCDIFTMQVSMQALGRCALGPARRVGQQRAASLVVRASTDDLEDWQVTKLKQALTKGRRQVEVSVGAVTDLCKRHRARNPPHTGLQVEKMSKDLGVPRQTVLQWLKDAPKPDP
jgi:DNA-binding XRE family transcriptional regulator